MSLKLCWAAALALGAQLATAQTYTDCNPMEETCPPNPGLAVYAHYTDFTTGPDAFERWETTAGSVTSTPLGAEFVINEQGDAPTIQSDYYIFFGSVEVKMRVASGTGIISTSVLQSDDLDEIDWEQVSTFDNQIQTNYFGKGNTTSYDRVTTVAVSSPEETFHTYTVNWTPTQIEWILDGTVVRTLGYYDALNGQNYPQTPMRIRIGIWAGGDPNNAPGTISWAGGETDYDAAPFTMYLESVNVVNYYPAEWYEWSDMTGSYGSIEPLNGTEGTGVPGAISKEPVAQEPGSDAPASVAPEPTPGPETPSPEDPTPAPAPSPEAPASEASPEPPVSEEPSPTPTEAPTTEAPVPGPGSEAPSSEPSPAPGGEAPISGAPVPGPGPEVTPTPSPEVPGAGVPGSEAPTETPGPVVPVPAVPGPEVPSSETPSEVPSSGAPSSETPIPGVPAPVPSSPEASPAAPSSNQGGPIPLPTPTHTPPHRPTPTHTPPQHTPHTSFTTSPVETPSPTSSSRPLIPPPGSQTPIGSPSSSSASGVATMAGGAARSIGVSVGAVVGAVLMGVVRF